MKELDFKSWLENSGPPGGLEPPKQNPEVMAKETKGGMVQYGGEPLPGNKKAMKKK